MRNPIYHCNFCSTKGPEAFAFKDNYVYTGIVGGDIVRMDLNSRERWGEIST